MHFGSDPMPNDFQPQVGDWYETDAGCAFEIVAADEESVEVQYFDGDVEAFDRDTWSELDLAPTAAPSDWSGPFDDLERDDLGEADLPPGARKHNPLDEL